MTAGLFGKLPSNGDFVTRRLPRGFVDPWDRWLQEGMAASRRQLGDAWLDAFLHSPVWRFALAPGACGERVGRYFPLTVAAPLADGVAPARGAWFADNWYAQAEATLLSALDKTLDLDRFDRSVEALGEPLAPQDGAPAARPAGAGRPVHDAPLCVSGGSADQLSMLFPDLLHAMLQDRYGAYSLWWTGGAEGMAPALLTCLGMPPASGYAALLDGAFDRWGWLADGALAGDAVDAAEAEAPPEDDAARAGSA
jgi:type VI secretion system protein ImpM